jgi:hypothetical protein
MSNLAKLVLRYIEEPYFARALTPEFRAECQLALAGRLIAGDY